MSAGYSWGECRTSATLGTLTLQLRVVTHLCAQSIGCHLPPALRLWADVLGWAREPGSQCPLPRGLPPQPMMDLKYPHGMQGSTPRHLQHVDGSEWRCDLLPQPHPHLVLSGNDSCQPHPEMSRAVLTTPANPKPTPLPPTAGEQKNPASLLPRNCYCPSRGWWQLLLREE